MRLYVHRQACFRAVVGVDEVEIEIRKLTLEELIRRRTTIAQHPRRRRPLTRREREQLYLFPPLLRPRSYFDRKPLTRAERAFGLEIVDDPRVPLPALSECQASSAPCPFVRCRYHLGIDVNEIGSLKVIFPGWEITDMRETCSERVARRGPQTVETVAELMNLSTERIRQIEREAWRKVRGFIDPDRLWRGPRPR